MWRQITADRREDLSTHATIRIAYACRIEALEVSARDSTTGLFTLIIGVIKEGATKHDICNGVIGGLASICNVVVAAPWVLVLAERFAKLPADRTNELG